MLWNQGQAKGQLEREEIVHIVRRHASKALLELAEMKAKAIAVAARWEDELDSAPGIWPGRARKSDKSSPEDHLIG